MCASFWDSYTSEIYVTSPKLPLPSSQLSPTARLPSLFSPQREWEWVRRSALELHLQGHTGAAPWPLRIQLPHSQSDYRSPTCGVIVRVREVACTQGVSKEFTDNAYDEKLCMDFKILGTKTNF